MGKIRSTLAFFMEKTLPDLIADELIARIFIGEFKAGYRLPAERGFAETLGVDRTSLRMALRTLNRMRLVQSVRGSGITVMDYQKCAGLDFLGAIFDIPQLELGTKIKREGLEAFNGIIPGMMYELVKGSFDATMAVTVRDILQKELNILDEGELTEERLDRLTVLHMELQDLVLYQNGSSIVALMANSSRVMRKQVMRELLEHIDIRANVEFNQQMFIDIGTGKLPVADVVGYYHHYSAEYTKPLIDYYNNNSTQSRLLASPLQSVLAKCS